MHLIQTEPFALCITSGKFCNMLSFNFLISEMGIIKVKLLEGLNDLISAAGMIVLLH